MKRYLRPLGILSGSAARLAVAEGEALPLAGGPLAFSLVEIIERHGPGQVERRIVPAVSLSDDLSLSSFPRKRKSSSIHAAEWKRLMSPQTRLSLNSRLRGNDGAESAAVMGILNVTPDSFSDGGSYFDAEAAIAHATALIVAGASFIDIGGESTRPGAVTIDPDEEIRRVVPVIAGIRALAEKAGVVISIDTRNAATMQAAIDAGAGLINDVSALTHDIHSLDVAAASGLPVVLMHMLGEPDRMQQAPVYDDVVLDIYDYLEARIAAVEAAGIDRGRILVDPGIGFGKTVAHNLALLAQLSLFHGLGAPVMVGVSRKGFISRLSVDEPADRRLGGSLAAGLAALAQGVRFLRVHDVPETVQAVRIAAALQDN